MSSVDKSVTTVNQTAELHSHQFASRLLFLEFETAWKHLGGLETKRFVLFATFHASFLLYFALLVAINLGTHEPLELRALIIALVLSVWMTAVSYACRLIAFSQRAATERYRNKINLIRKICIESANDELKDFVEIGKPFGVRIDILPRKPLRLMDLASSSGRATDLYMKITYDVGIIISSGFACAILLILMQ